MQRPIIFVTICLGIALAVHAENWPNWRGPSASGVSPEKGLPATWSDTQNLAWKARLRGLGISSPIVWSDRIFVTSQAGSGLSRRGPRLYQQGDAAAAGERPLGGSAAGPSSARGNVSFLISAFHRASGRQLWEYELPAEGALPPVHDKHNLASSSPVTEGEHVYAWFGTGQVVALDLNGKLVWKRNLGAEYGPFDIEWGHGSSPVLHKDTLILACFQPSASYLLGLDSSTGKVRWKVNLARGSVSYSTPLVIETAGAAELVVNSSEGISGHNVSTGERLWHFAESNSYPIPTPVHHNGVIYSSRGYRSSPFMAIRTGGKGNVAGSHVLWRVATGAPYMSSLVYYEGLVYMVGDVGVVTVTDSKTGARVWQQRIGGVFTASPVVADGKVYFLSEGGETVVLEAGRNPRVIARNKLDARQLASPAISGGRLFIRSDNVLYAIGK